MKITKEQLDKIIEEEKSKIIAEKEYAAAVMKFCIYFTISLIIFLTLISLHPYISLHP